MTEHSGGLWDNELWELHVNEKVHFYGSSVPCKHVTDFVEENGIRYSIVPYVVVAYNEGGSCTTGVCAQCIVEVMEKA